MSQAVQADKPVGAVDATVMYSIDTGAKPVNETFGPGDMRRRQRGGQRQGQTVTIADGRAARSDWALDVHGFEFIHRHTTQRRHGFSLAACGQNNDLVGWKLFDFSGRDEEILGKVEIAQL